MASFPHLLPVFRPKAPLFQSLNAVNFSTKKISLLSSFAKESRKKRTRAKKYLFTLNDGLTRLKYKFLEEKSRKPYALAHGGVSLGNDIRVSAFGRHMYQVMWDAIDSSKSHVWLQTYIFEPDPIGMIFIKKLTEAAKRGVQVILAYDSVGSPTVSEDHFRDLKSAGGFVVDFNPPWRWFKPIHHALSFRNHRKILAVDDIIGFCGGMNISKDYSGLGPRDFGALRDTHFMLQGPAVQHLGQVFLDGLSTAGAKTQNFLAWFGDPMQMRRGVQRSASVSGADVGGWVQVLRSNVFRRRRLIQRALCKTVADAKKFVYLTTPYFLPSKRLVKAMIKSARRGVDVRVLTAGDTDVWFMRYAARYVYDVLLEHDIGLYEYYGRKLHTKTAVVDHHFASIGSFNLDRLSDIKNLEMNIQTFGVHTSLALQAHFMEDLRRSSPIRLEHLPKMSWWDKAFGWFVYNCMNWLL